jgi:PKD repeat protein
MVAVNRALIGMNQGFTGRDYSIARTTAQQDATNVAGRIAMTFHRSWTGSLACLLTTVGLGLAACSEDSGPSNAPPTVTFAIQCADLGCRFVNGSSDADGALESYAWDFGDESAPATTRDANHTYAAAGTFTVTLTVTDDEGEAVSGTAKVTVHTPADPGGVLTVSFSADCVGLICDFTDRSAASASAVYTWTFGDQSEPLTSRDVQHTYGAEGDFLVSLTILDGGRQVSATRTLHVELVNLPPAAQFVYTCTDLTCEFTDQSTDEIGGLASFRWDFGDGQISTDRNPSHTYAQAAHYTVDLTVTDARGATGAAARQFTLPAVGWPTANLRSSCYGNSCAFHTESTGGVIASWQWDFGDGGTSTLENPSHFYERNGTYRVQVTFTDAGGASNTASGEVTVPVPLNAAFTATCEGTTCTFNNQSTGWVSAFWDFGDGTTSGDWSPFHVYQVSEPTTFTVQLTVFDFDSFTDTVSVDVTVTP